MVPCTVKNGVQLIPKEGTRINWDLQRFGLHLRNMRLVGGDIARFLQIKLKAYSGKSAKNTLH